MKKLFLASLLLPNLMQSAASDLSSLLSQLGLPTPQTFVLESVELPQGTLSISTSSIGIIGLSMMRPCDKGFSIGKWAHTRDGKKYQGACALYATTELSTRESGSFVHTLCQDFMEKCRQRLCFDTKEELESNINKIAQETNACAAGVALSPGLMFGILVQNGTVYSLLQKYNKDVSASGPFPDIELLPHTVAVQKVFSQGTGSFDLTWECKK